MKKIGLKLLSFILIESFIFAFLQMFFINSKTAEAASLSSSYTQYVTTGISSFPESYQKKLAYLKYLHPNWEFKAYYTGISWSEVTSSSAENKCLRNTIYYKSGSAIVDPAILCICGKTGDSNYYCASSKAVNYYLDPRNFLDQAMIFQFLDLSSSSSVSRDAVYSAVKGTYLEQYTDYIMQAASEAGINPLHIVATIFQELGKSSNTPAAVTGTYSGCEGYYNFYNYGATDGSGATARAMAKAKEMGWNSAKTALIEGAKKVLANSYISAGQTTKYFYKFDVVGNEIINENSGKKTYSSSYFYNHQYMTNLRDPSSQAGILYDLYVNNNILNENLVFVIPVYNDMPTASESAPSSYSGTDGEMYIISTLKNGSLNVRSSASTTATSKGKIYKNVLVKKLGEEGIWSQIEYCTATTYNSSTKTWNSERKTGYVKTEYLQALGTSVADYRSQVDMGSGSSSSSTKLGDVSGDSKLDSMDMYQIIQYLLGNYTFNSTQKTAADVNKDGKIDSMDMYQIIQCLLGNISL